jgi:alpha-galactosidase
MKTKYDRWKRALRLAAGLLTLTGGLCLPLSAAPASLMPDPDDLRIEGDLGNFKSSWEIATPEPGVMLATLKLDAPVPAVPPAFALQWSFPAIDIAGVWVSDYDKDKDDHLATRLETRAVQRAPLLCYFSQGDGNRLTVAVSDSLRPLCLRAHLREEDLRLHVTLRLFDEKQPPLKNYRITLRFDARPLPYHVVLGDTSRWWAGQDHYQPAPVPETARVPVFSTWYGYHQNLDADQIVEECRIGGELGLGGVIVDDGWQTLDGNRGYAHTGDWKPERIPDMKGFVDRIHALGQKCMLWYSVPMVGGKSEAVKRFRGKTLYYQSGFDAHVLDPRYPEVREYLINIYENALRDWGIDGFKFDFIELFAPKKDTVLTAEDGRDIASVDVAVDRLMTDIMARLRAINPDIAIEFRQPYNGPLMRKYGNMLRAVDCPNSASLNRRLTTDVRLTAGRTAVHADPIIWHDDEPVESAALQILNPLFGVPQVSVRLSEASAAHRSMIGFWMRYWRDNRDVLLDGSFEPVGPAMNYPMIIGRNDAKMIAALYQEMVVSPGSKAPPRIDVVNARPGRDVVVRFTEPFGRAKVEILDCRGNKMVEELRLIDAGVSLWQVPPSGLLRIERAGE